MPHHQLTLWDNEALEKGYRCLASLKLEEAELQFKEALNGYFVNSEHISRAIDACQNWKPFISPTKLNTEKYNSVIAIDEFLGYYVDYPFTTEMKEFKKAVLGQLFLLLRDTDPMDLIIVGTVFDLLVGIGDIGKARNLISIGLNRFPKNHHLRYLLAQGQWLNGEISKANQTYALLLLHFPMEIEKDRIENKQLLMLINKYGAVMAPAYGWIQKVVPFVLISDEIIVNDEEHRQAIECYRLIHSATKSMKDRNMEATVQYRKRLKELSPELFKEYFTWMRREGELIFANRILRLS